MTSIAQVVIDKYTSPQEAPVPSVVKVVKPITAARTAPSDAVLKTKEELQSALRVGIWTVEYKKVDGTNGIMECTLDPRHLPQPKDPSHVQVLRVRPADVLQVYATDRQGWRSFVVQNVTLVYRVVENL